MSRLSPAFLWRLAAATALAASVVVLAGWLARDDPPPRYAISGASAERGRAALADYGCRTCHAIPGVGGFTPETGPPLARWSQRRYVAGRLPNTPRNLVRWITDPQDVVPGNAMPDVGVPEPTARDIAAYLYQLR